MTPIGNLFSPPAFSPTLKEFEAEDRIWEKRQDQKDAEAIFRDPQKCVKLGIEQDQALVQYLRKYGSFINKKDN